MHPTTCKDLLVLLQKSAEENSNSRPPPNEPVCALEPAVKQELPARVSDLLAPHGLTPAHCSYAVHTGGPKVIAGVAAALGVSADTMGASWHVMQKYSNLSGASNLVVLDHMRRMAAAGDPSVQRRPYTICISMGPGACIELALLQNLSWAGN